MSEQDATESSTKQRRSRKTSAANQQNGKQAPATQRPVNDNTEAWKAYWKAQGQEWRIEPEINKDRQKYLTERRSIKLNIEQGIYPFKDIKLSRADVEWLLATHKKGRGAVDWNDESQREREGLDLRGAILRQENLSRLPLTRLYGGLGSNDWGIVTEERLNIAAVLLQGADLSFAQLQQANLGRAKLQQAYLYGVQLQQADLKVAQLQGADLSFAQLQQASLTGAQLQQANLGGAQLQQASLTGAQLQQASLIGAQLQQANLSFAQLQQADLKVAQLQGADLHRTDLEDATLDEVMLSDLTYGSARFVDIKWGNVNLAVVNWGLVTRLGDESEAQQKKNKQGKIKEKQTRVDEYKDAVRAYRQLSVVLHNQGLNEDAARFSYRAQLMQRKVFWHQGIRSLGQYLFSFFLDLLTGYGYKPLRSFIAYAVVISLFATIYFLLGSHLTWNETIVISMTAFHGRGFFPEQFHPGDPQALVAAIEAFVGLLIEVTFIATLTQRLFGK